LSCFAGLLNLDGAPVDPALLARMADRLAYRSPDGMASWSDGAVGMVHGRLWTTPEEVGEEQPIADVSGRVWLAADARIDNRSELLADLRHSQPDLAEDASDTRLLLAGYQSFGARVCDRALGDFAFALWDGARRRLLLARDAMGMRQLYYARREGTLAFGSTIGSVLAALAERPPLNRQLIEAFLHDSYRHWIEGTVFAGVLRVAPGHLLTADEGGLRQQLWWELGSTFAGSFASDEEWAGGFRRVFDLAVSSRLRSATPVALLAGGGVDSAAIASTAHAATAAERLRLYCLTFEGTPTADESDYFDELDRGLAGVASQRIPATELPLALGRVATDDQPLDEPEVYLLRSHTAALFDAAARDGCRVVLAGEGANQVLGHAFYYDPRALRHVGWRELAAELPRFRSTTGIGTAELLARAFLWPVLPAALQEVLRRLRPGDRQWVRCAGRGSWRDRLPPLPRRALAASLGPGGRWAAHSIGRPFDLARHSAIDVTAAHAGVEWRLPFLDRRVVDLLLHAPRRLRSWHGGDRRILRLAMAGRMPERIRRRVTKSHIQDVLHGRLRYEERPAVERLLDKPRAEALEFVTGSVAAVFDNLRAGTGTAYRLLSFLCLESWLRRLPEEIDQQMSDKRPEAPKAPEPSAESRRGNPYHPPELQEYGSLKELTRTLSTQVPGDGFGASFAT
jgi:asparagine synthase (glutamine-hydrolysing)